MNIVEIIIAAIKAKLMPVTSKLRLYTSKSFLKNKLLARIRNFFLGLFDVRPRDEKDYYAFLGWLVSRRLAMAASVVVIVLCLGFLWKTKPEKAQGESPYKAYKYDSVMLKFATGKVQILGKSGYTAYIGDVEKGMVKGTGRLYDPKGNVVYEGEFDANAYNGTGKAYYADLESGTGSQLKYEGTFKDNVYEGVGKLYRENGTLSYEGSFRMGNMDGEGTLYGASQEPIYAGHFSQGQIMYPELLGKRTDEVAKMYTGARDVVIADNIYAVFMKGIDAIYYDDGGGNTLESEYKVKGVYVLQPFICFDNENVEETARLGEIFGAPVYEGNTYLEPKDEIALNKACWLRGQDVLYGKASYKETAVYDDVAQAQDFARNYQAYIYVYEKDEIVYTFFSKDRDDGFEFYLIER